MFKINRKWWYIGGIVLLIIISIAKKIPSKKVSNNGAAKTLCGTIENLGESCSYDVPTKQVVAVISASETARQLCSGISRMANDQGLNFAKGWTLMIIKGHLKSNHRARCAL